jgi:hypothetical protein
MQVFGFPHKLFMIQSEVTSKAQTCVLALLLRMEMTQGKDAMPARTSGFETPVFDVFGVRRALFINLTQYTFENKDRKI